MDHYLYIACFGQADSAISEINGNSPSVIGALYGVGNAREMAFCNNGEAVIVSSRENGVFIEKQNGGGVYAHKYDNWIEISQELVWDTRMDKVQQSYMNKALASLLGGKEKVESVA